MLLWNLYFLIKFGLHFSGQLTLSPLWNLGLFALLIATNPAAYQNKQLMKVLRYLVFTGPAIALLLHEPGFGGVTGAGGSNQGPVRLLARLPVGVAQTHHSTLDAVGSTVGFYGGTGARPVHTHQHLGWVRTGVHIGYSGIAFYSTTDPNQ